MTAGPEANSLHTFGAAPQTLRGSPLHDHVINDDGFDVEGVIDVD